nr:peritrophin-48-like [Procambarus clarkii]
MAKQLLLVSLSVAWVAALLCGLAAGICEPDCSGPSPPPIIPDPLNCTQFYLCLATDLPSDAPGSCPAGTSFNPIAVDCSGTTPCRPNCTLPACISTCTNDLDKIYDRTNCSRYSICYGSSLLGPFDCPADQPYFDGVKQACSADKRRCCIDPCIAYCYTAGTETPDPYDCTKYYLCVDVGLPYEMFHNTCPSGSTFDAQLGHCVDGATCNTLCNDTTVLGGGITSI